MQTVPNNLPVVNDIVGKLWSLFSVLKDDGVTYHQYVTEMTYLLFLKMAKEAKAEDTIPEGYRWDDLEKAYQKDAKTSKDLRAYNKLLKGLSKSNGTAGEIYRNAVSSIKKPRSLEKLITEIDKLAWFSVSQERMGDLYEGLLEKNASEVKSGAGQYFTPRPLVESMVAVMRPSLKDIIQDPAAGTGGFIIAASSYIRAQSDPKTWNKSQRKKYQQNTFFALEHVYDTYRLALMNLALHGIESDPNGAGVHYGDTLGKEGEGFSTILTTLFLSNPPFGTSAGGGLPTRKDFPFPTSNKQLCFLQHIYRGLKAGGRAAVILPDNVLFEGNVGRQIRADLMDKCNLHTILRLPTGIFYAQGVKTNVLFFTRGKTDRGNTKEVWVYDLRANMPNFGKRTEFTRSYFAEFEAAFGPDPLGGPEALAKRVDTGEGGRFRKFSREYIAERGESLDISWLKDDSETEADELPEPAVLARSVMAELEAAMLEIQGILEELGEEVEEVGA